MTPKDYNARHWNTKGKNSASIGRQHHGGCGGLKFWSCSQHSRVSAIQNEEPTATNEQQRLNAGVKMGNDKGAMKGNKTPKR
jgi:hypothetical protein